MYANAGENITLGNYKLFNLNPKLGTVSGCLDLSSSSASWKSTAWVFREEHNNDLENFVVEENETENELLVSFFNINHIFTGLYTCSDGVNSSSIYLYVNG